MLYKSDTLLKDEFFFCCIKVYDRSKRTYLFALCYSTVNPREGPHR